MEKEQGWKVVEGREERKEEVKIRIAHHEFHLFL
jgi:hypothetical protein